MAAYGVEVLLKSAAKPENRQVGEALTYKQLDSLAWEARGHGAGVSFVNNETLRLTFTTQKAWLAVAKLLWRDPGFFTIEVIKIL